MTRPDPLDDPAEMLAWLQMAHACDRRVPLLPFYGHHGPADRVGPWVLSQWWPEQFVLDGVTYPHAEAAMMAGKARLFGDDAALKAILTSNSPAAAKAAGRAVRNFDQQVWTAHAFELVVAINVAKFSARPPLRDYLLATAPAVLVEASPRDQVWGVGLAAGDPRLADARQWRGQNLLGFALTRTRRLLST